jgi:hypothetical protein
MKMILKRRKEWKLTLHKNAIPTSRPVINHYYMIAFIYLLHDLYLNIYVRVYAHFIAFDPFFIAF